MHKVSIILPSYNHKQYLLDRLHTIKNQTYKYWELVIIDDASTDGSIEVLKKFKEENSNKISNFIVNKKNSGSGYKSWQKGIELAKGKYIWIAETDDYSDCFFLEKLVNALENNSKAALAFCNSVYVNKHRKKMYTSEKRTHDLEVKKKTSKVFDNKLFMDTVLFNPYITNGSAVVFKNPSDNIPNKLFSYKQSSDMFLWTYLIKDRSFVFVNEYLNYFRRHENSTTVKNNISNLKMIYSEKISFLNYFNFKDKKKEFLQHYIKYYVWNNKKQWYKIKFLYRLNDNRFLAFLYYKHLLRFLINKI